MGISRYPTAVTLPPAREPFPSMLQFLSQRFPGIDRDRWQERLRAGKVLDEAGNPITEQTPYVPNRKIFYFREVAGEQTIPFAEKILFQSDTLLVACKPHFLPVIPGGRYVDECLLHRLRESTGIADLSPIHRIDRETAGLVLFSTNKETRGLYQRLFADGKIEKTYHAIAEYTQPAMTTEWLVETRIVRGEPWVRRKTVPGEVNARSHIHLVEVQGQRARFKLHPLTGKTHQLRIHMSELGFQIANDRYYPVMWPEGEDYFDQPLQLLAKSVKFTDPISGQPVEFVSERELLL